MATSIEIFLVILQPLHTGCVKVAFFLCVFSHRSQISCWFSILSVASLKSLWIPSDEVVLGFGAYSLSFGAYSLSFCACYFLLLPKSFPVFWSAEEDRRYLAYSCHCKESFLPSVPRCCSVITDILKQQRKKITLGIRKDFCWGISAGCSSFGVGWLGGFGSRRRSGFSGRTGRAVNVWGLWDLPRHKGEAFHGSVVGCGTELSLSPQLLEAGRCRGSHLRAEWSGNLVRAAQTSQPCAEGLTSAPAAPVGSTERVVLGTECAYSVPSESICGWILQYDLTR